MQSFPITGKSLTLIHGQIPQEKPRLLAEALLKVMKDAHLSSSTASKL
jgi:hypothetical protein